MGGSAPRNAAPDPGWTTADPTPLVPDHAQRLAELAALDAGLADLYRRGAELLAGAPDAAALQERHTALLGRERGVVSRALAELPALPVEARKTRGRGLNLVKRWLAEVEEARRLALERE